MGRKKKERLENLELFKYLIKEETKKRKKGIGKDIIKAMVSLRNKDSNWRGLMAIPAGSVIDKTLNVFRVNTDVPLEIPFFSVFHFISAWLLKKEVQIVIKGQRLNPDLWTIILAESGSGKTFVTSILKNTCDLDIDVGIGEIASAAKFVEELKEHNRSLWIRDEFAQLLKAIQNLTHMVEMKDYLLRLYDGERIERKTKKETIVIENPVISILGLTVKSAFVKNVTTEDMIDGQAQRFCYVIADLDSNRPLKNFAIYDYEKIVKQMAEAWEQVKNIPIHKEYLVNDKGIEAYETAFKLLFERFENIDKSFYRRILWRSVKYSLIYHILLGKESNELDDVDMSWAARLATLHLQDAKWLLESHGMSELEKVIVSAEKLKKRYEEQGKTLTARDLISNISAIKSIKEAQVIMSFI